MQWHHSALHSNSSSELTNCGLASGGMSLTTLSHTHGFWITGFPTYMLWCTWIELSSAINHGQSHPSIYTTNTSWKTLLSTTSLGTNLSNSMLAACTCRSQPWQRSPTIQEWNFPSSIPHIGIHLPKRLGHHQHVNSIMAKCCTSFSYMLSDMVHNSTNYLHQITQWQMLTTTTGCMDAQLCTPLILELASAQPWAPALPTSPQWHPLASDLRHNNDVLWWSFLWPFQPIKSFRAHQLHLLIQLWDTSGSLYCPFLLNVLQPRVWPITQHSKNNSVLVSFHHNMLSLVCFTKPTWPTHSSTSCNQKPCDDCQQHLHPEEWQEQLCMADCTWTHLSLARDWTCLWSRNWHLLQTCQGQWPFCSTNIPHLLCAVLQHPSTPSDDKIPLQQHWSNHKLEIHARQCYSTSKWYNQWQPQYLHHNHCHGHSMSPTQAPIPPSKVTKTITPTDHWW